MCKGLISFKRGEPETFEFKTSFDKELIGTITAFANSKGGTITIGVSCKGKTAGVQLDKESLPKYINQVKVNTSPPVIPGIKILEALECDGLPGRLEHKVVDYLRLNFFKVEK